MSTSEDGISIIKRAWAEFNPYLPCWPTVAAGLLFWAASPERPLWGWLVGPGLVALVVGMRRRAGPWGRLRETVWFQLIRWSGAWGWVEAGGELYWRDGAGALFPLFALASGLPFYVWALARGQGSPRDGWADTAGRAAMFALADQAFAAFDFTVGTHLYGWPSLMAGMALAGISWPGFILAWGAEEIAARREWRVGLGRGLGLALVLFGFSAGLAHLLHDDRRPAPVAWTLAPTDISVAEATAAHHPRQRDLAAYDRVLKRLDEALATARGPVLMAESLVPRGIETEPPGSPGARWWEEWRARLAQARVPVLWGGTLPTPDGTYNVLRWQTPGGDRLEFAKRLPMPFGEALPPWPGAALVRRRFFSRDLRAGEWRAQLVSHGGSTWAVVNCSEVFSAALARHQRREGIGGFLWAGNESAVDRTSASAFLEAAAVARAVETAAPLVKVANRGLSGTFSARGERELREEGPRHVAVAPAGNISLAVSYPAGGPVIYGLLIALGLRRRFRRGPKGQGVDQHAHGDGQQA